MDKEISGKGKESKGGGRMGRREGREEGGRWMHNNTIEKIVKRRKGRGKEEEGNREIRKDSSEE